MSKGIHLVMPMGGSGSRFYKDGFVIPKPLIEIEGRPFFFWATQSIKKYVSLKSLTFVVLREHVGDFKIDQVILKYFPEARITMIPQVLNGAVLTCLEGVKDLDDNYPVIFNDCDHAFISSGLYNFCLAGDVEYVDGALLTFHSNDPKFSYIESDPNDWVIRTAEKQAISSNAICGAYYFKNKSVFMEATERYLEKCNYSEYFLSGVYNIMIEDKKIIKSFDVEYHLPFGTPEEYSVAAETGDFERFK